MFTCYNNFDESSGDSLGEAKSNLSKQEIGNIYFIAPLGDTSQPRTFSEI